MADWLKRLEEKPKYEDFPSSGGTEILRNKLYKYTSISKNDKINLLLSTPNIENIKYTKKNLLWQHLNFTDESLNPLRDQNFIRSIDAQVYVSNWQYEKFRYVYQIPTDNAYVIKNAIDQIEFKKREKTEKIKLIYTSTPWRGLDVLLESFNNLNRDDVELHVYSSTIIYGSGFANYVGNKYDELFEIAKNMKNVKYFGYASNEDVIKALQECHIFAYPSIFEETSCLAMIEAGAAGCDLVTTNLGALLETGSTYAKMLEMKNDRYSLVSSYTKFLNDAIDNYWSKSNQNLLKEQSEFYNKYYNWELIVPKWEKLFNELSN